MKVRISTVKFSGQGAVHCRRCSHRTVFPDDAAVIIFDYTPGIFPLPGVTDGMGGQIVLDADSLATLHRCGLEYFWWCDTCGIEGNRAPRQWRGNWTHKCEQCHGDLEQRVRNPAGLAP